jgi:Zn-dependent peptidase ImmA (M78 family)
MKNQKINPKISSERTSVIELLASDVYDSGVQNGSLDLEYILQLEGITVDYNDYEDDFDAILKWYSNSEKYHIHLNTSRGNLPGAPRTRFTLAHEFGHYYIDEHRKALRSGQLGLHLSGQDQKVSDLAIEQEANLFASALLLPDTAFRNSLKRKSFDLKGIVEAANGFNVSITCAAIRFVSKEIFPSVIVMWKKDEYCWKWISQKWFSAGFRGNFITYSELPKDSSTYKALNDSQGFGILENSSLSCYWFRSFPMGSKYDFLIKEQAVRLGNHGVLTVLTPHSLNELQKMEALIRENLGEDF